MSPTVASLRARVKQLLQAGRDDRRVKTGATAIVRALLPEIEEMRANDVPWRVIAAALGEQGVVETRGDVRRPIGERRLSAIVADLREQAVRKAERQQRRAGRSDLVRPSPATPRLSDEMKIVPSPDTAADTAETETRLRRAAFAEFQSLKKD